MTRILVVEDDETIAAAIGERLRSEGFIISLAANGQAGLDLDLRERPDLVLLDLMLPGIDGLEVCRRLRARRDVPVIMLTARDDETDLLVGAERLGPACRGRAVGTGSRWVDDGPVARIAARR